jgi:DNA-directed RNA polymerase specialized sigma24 family protein
MRKCRTSTSGMDRRCWLMQLACWAVAHRLKTWLVKPQGMMEAGIEVERALRDLPSEQREVVLMRVWGEMTLEEIATMLDVPANTVASRYRYALGKLREILKVEDKP